jgi:putative endonuclease
MNDKQTLGAFGEEAVKNLYAKHGFKILIRNYYNHRGKRRGEIDFVAVKNKHLHFVEVKTRTSIRFGTPEEAVTFAKRQRLLIAVKFFLNYFRQFQDFALHVDVAGVYVSFDKTIEKIKITSDAIDEFC